MYYDFIIYGGGISAQITALALARKNFTVCLITDGFTDKTKSNLVTFFSLGSINYLISILENPSELEEFVDIEKIICCFEYSKRGQNITFNDTENSMLGKILPNAFIGSLLDKNTRLSKKITIIENSKIVHKENNSNGITVTLDDKSKIISRIFILSSTMNKKILNNSGIKFIDQDFNQTALSINVSGNFKNASQAFQIFTTKGPLAFLPYLKDHASVVWSLKNDSEEINFDIKKIEKKINSFLANKIGILSVKDIEKHKLKFSFAKKLFHDHTVIIGNAAHNIHPIAGQGLNLSIKDIFLFSEIVTKYSNIGYEINNKIVLDEFNKSRKVDNAAYSFGTLALNSILSSKNKFVNMASVLGTSVLEKSTIIKRKIVSSATGRDFFKPN